MASPPPSNFNRLCSLLGDSLIPYTETEALLLTKEKEKDLLVLLSQISRKIKSWTDELRLHSDDEIVVNSAPNGECRHVLGLPSGEGSNCLANVVYILVAFLTVDSQYVQHTAGNILVAISDFVFQHGSNGKILFQLLWASLEAVILKIHSSTLSESKISEEERLTQCYTYMTNDDASSFISLLFPKLWNANWVTATALLQVLRKILKFFKTNYNELTEEYFHSFSYSLPNVSWELLHENHVAHFSGTRMIYSKDSSLQCNMSSSGEKHIFLAILLQIFCSLVDHNGFGEVNRSTLDDPPIVIKIIDLVPSLLCWCLSRHVEYSHIYISRYLRHKMLMLMIRLSFHTHHQCATMLLWLQLLRQYFEDLLHEPISECHDDFGTFLEGSPFQVCTADGEKVHNKCTRHLQRQAILLLFKCSFSLISFSDETGRQCTCAERGRCSTKALSELSEWLQRHVPPEMFVDYDTYLNICSGFALSFLRLYIDEDDFLFEMLLQLLSTALYSKSIQFKQNGNMIEEMIGDKCLYISCIFNPIRLFHLFLAELHYDHVVLLDYLISKDSGVHCAQYLLRCLRIVCKSLHIFAEFSFYGTEVSQTSCEKREVGIQKQDSHGKELSIEGIRNSKFLKKRKRVWNESGGMHKTFRQEAFENSKRCLISLKESVENLHQKNLFPYNPSALLRS